MLVKAANAVLIAATLVTAGLVAAAPANGQTIDLATIKCKDFVELSKETVATLTVWLDGYYTDAQSQPVAALEGVARANRKNARHVDACALLNAHHIAASRIRQGCQHFGGRRHFSEFARIGGADIGQRVERTVGCAPQAQLV